MSQTRVIAVVLITVLLVLLLLSHGAFWLNGSGPP